MYNVYQMVRDQQKKQQDALEDAARQRLYRQIRASKAERKPNQLLRLVRWVVQTAPKREPKADVEIESSYKRSRI